MLATQSACNGPWGGIQVPSSTQAHGHCCKRPSWNLRAAFPFLAPSDWDGVADLPRPRFNMVPIVVTGISAHELLCRASPAQILLRWHFYYKSWVPILFTSIQKFLLSWKLAHMGLAGENVFPPNLKGKKKKLGSAVFNLGNRCGGVYVGIETSEISCRHTPHFLFVVCLFVLLWAFGTWNIP